MNVQPQIDPPKVVTAEDTIENKIIRLLRIYPKISPSMMQIGIGSSLPVNIWKPILNKLIEDGTVKEDFLVVPSASGRQQSHTILSLATLEPEVTQA